MDEIIKAIASDMNRALAAGILAEQILDLEMAAAAKATWVECCELVATFDLGSRVWPLVGMAVSL